MRRHRLALLLATLLLAGTAVALPGADADPTADDDRIVVGPAASVVRLALIEVDDDRTLHDLEDFHGIDLAHWQEPTEDDTILSAAFVTELEMDYLAELGVEVLEVDELPSGDEVTSQLVGELSEEEFDAAVQRSDERAAQQARDLELRQQALADPTTSSVGTASVPPPVDETELLRVLRADTFSNYSGDFVSLEVRSLFSEAAVGAAERPERITATYRDGSRILTRDLSTFVDANQYIYHRLPRPVAVVGVPDEVTLRIYERGTDGQGNPTESLLEELTVPFEPWAGYDQIGYPEGFQRAFVPGYLDSVSSTAAMFELEAQFPDLVEVVELPNETGGYQRKAVTTLIPPTDPLASQVYSVETLEWGHLGGNDVTFEATTNDGTPNQVLGVRVDNDTDVVVDLQTDGAGNSVSTAAQIVGAINTDADASEIVRAFTYRGNAGTGVTPAYASRPLSDNLSAPDTIPRGPRTVYALRIGAERDGSQTGVFAYSQEHAREWVTPVVAVETASRLLHNYGTHELTTDLVDNLDIFIVPTVNPDGTDYSLYDFQAQRRNMTDYCGDADTNGRTNQLGVDLNRNFREYNLEQGYAGASTSCTSDIFAGPEPLSEPEARNTAWIMDEFPNIRFAMNVHTFGGYFMWAPGSYANPGRVPAPRPELGIEDYFFDVSETVLGRIAEHRGTVIEPGRTGPIIDVLYSAAGNSADDLYYRGDRAGEPVFAYSFEAGAERFIGGRWQGVGSFYPNYTQEGFDQAMEFSNGLYGLFEAALEFEFDEQAPTTEANVSGDLNYTGPADVFFESDEPATIHYTLDGSEPTLESDTVGRWGADELASGGARDGADPIRITETTTLRWFGVDAKGNQEAPQSVRVHINEEPDDGNGGDDGDGGDGGDDGNGGGDGGDGPVGQTCQTVGSRTFGDVAGGPHGANISCVAGFGIAQGWADGTYRPGNDVQRDQMTSFLARLLQAAGVSLPAAPEDGFPDDQGGVHELATNQLAELGIVEGRGDGRFDPTASVTRAQMASFLVRSLEVVLERDLSAAPSSFTDVGNSPHAGNIDIAAAMDIALGRTSTTYAPNADVRRDQMASFLARTIDALIDQDVSLTSLR